MRRTRSDWLFELIAAAAVLTGPVYLAVHWNELPQKVPRHFGISGQADGWGDKTGLLILPVIALVIWCVLTAASKYQQFINLPLDVDRERPAVKALLLSLSVVLKTVMACIFAYITWAAVNVTPGQASGLGRLFLPAMLAATALPLVYYLLKLRAYRKQ